MEGFYFYACLHRINHEQNVEVKFMTDDSLRFSQAAQCLSPRLLSRVKDLEKDLAYSASELRLRVNRPLSVSCADKSCYITESGELTENISGGCSRLKKRILTIALATSASIRFMPDKARSPAAL